MEFLDINLAKDSMPFTVPFYWRISKKTILFPGFKNPYRKSAKQENLSLFINSIVQNGKMRVENQTKLQNSLRRLEFMPRNLDKKMSFKDSISVQRSICTSIYIESAQSYHTLVFVQKNSCWLKQRPYIYFIRLLPVSPAFSVQYP